MTKITSYNLKGIKHILFKFIAIGFVPLVAITAAAVILPLKPSAVKWANDNYSGFESREDWDTYSSVMSYLDSLPYGRVMYDYDKSILTPLGTSRALELIPYWTKQSTMEGLLAESSMSSPFHYINKGKFITEDRTSIAGWPVPGNRDYASAMELLNYYNISYIIATSSEIIEDLDSDSRVEFLNVIEPFYFYEIKGPHNYVEIAKNIPYRYSTDNWLWEMRDWYWNADNMDNPVVYYDGSEELRQFKEIPGDRLGDVPDNPEEDGGEILSENLERERIEFTTTAIGVPHIIKVSYFPAWKAEGAYGPYLVSPSLMMVIPTQSDVTLYYGTTYANIIGIVLSCLGLLILSLIIVLNIAYYFKVKRRRSII